MEPLNEKLFLLLQDIASKNDSLDPVGSTNLQDDKITKKMPDPVGHDILNESFLLLPPRRCDGYG